MLWEEHRAAIAATEATIIPTKRRIDDLREQIEELEEEYAALRRESQSNMQDVGVGGATTRRSSPRRSSSPLAESTGLHLLEKQRQLRRLEVTLAVEQRAAAAYKAVADRAAADKAAADREAALYRSSPGRRPIADVSAVGTAGRAPAERYVMEHVDHVERTATVHWGAEPEGANSAAARMPSQSALHQEPTARDDAIAIGLQEVAQPQQQLSAEQKEERRRLEEEAAKEAEQQASRARFAEQRAAQAAERQAAAERRNAADRVAAVYKARREREAAEKAAADKAAAERAAAARAAIERRAAAEKAAAERAAAVRAAAKRLAEERAAAERAAAEHAAALLEAAERARAEAAAVEAAQLARASAPYNAQRELQLALRAKPRLDSPRVLDHQRAAPSPRGPFQPHRNRAQRERRRIAVSV